MARKGSNISILQFGPSFISLLKVKPGLPQLRVVASKVERGDWRASDASLGEALGRFADANRLAGDRLFTVLPRHETTLRVLELPSQSDDEIEGMVRLSAEEIVPFSAEELVTGHCILEKLAQGSSKVLAVVVHRDVIDAHLQELKSAGLVPEQILLSTECLMAAGGSDSQGSNAIVHLSPGGIEILILDDGRFAYGRGIATERLWDESGPDQGAGEELASEVRASLATHRRASHDAGGTETISVSSGCVDTRPIARKLGDDLGLSCREASQVLQNVGPGVEGLQFTPAVALGAALIAQKPGEHHVELMPRTVMRKREAASLRLRLARVAAMLAVALVSFGGAYWQAVAQRSAYIEELEARAEVLRPLARSVATKRQQLRMLQRRVERESTVLELLGGIARLAPKEGLNITRFDYERENGITLYGRALEARFFDGMIDRLRGEGAQTFSQFAQAQESYRTLRKERAQEVWDFSIAIPFDQKGSGDE